MGSHAIPFMTRTCSVCTRPHDSEGEGARSTWCELCTSIVDQATDHRWLHSLDLNAVDWAYDVVPIGPSTQRWRGLREVPYIAEQADWARLSDPEHDPVVSWGAGEEAFAAASSLVIAGETIDRASRRALAAGVVLSTGHVMQFTDQGVVLDGVGPLDGAPWKDLLRVLTSSHRIGWDLAALTIALTAAAGEGAVQGTHRTHRWMRNHIERSIHPLLNWIHVHAHIGTPMDATSRAWILEETARQRVHRDRSDFHDALARRPLRCLEGWVEPWLQAWWVGAPEDAQHVHNPNPLRLRHGRLRLSVPTPKRSSLHLKVPAEPMFWAWLVQAVLQPAWSEGAHRLHAICAGWRLPQPLDEVAEPLRRSIALLNGVLDENAERTAIDGPRILVRGRLGHGYSVTAGQGAHGAPFVVHGLDGQGRTIPSPLCILDDRGGPERPLGDLFGTVVLSLLDDVGLSRTIRSLEAHMRGTTPAFDGMPVSVNDLTLGLPWCDADESRQALDRLRPVWHGQEGTRVGQAVLPQAAFEAAWRENQTVERGRGGWLQGMMMDGHRNAEIFRQFMQERERRNVEGGNDLQRAFFMQQMDIGRQLERDLAADLRLRHRGRRELGVDPFEAIRRNLHVEHRERWEEHDPREGARRWRDLYARVWAAVAGAGERPRPVRLTGHPPYDVALPSGLQFTVRDQREDEWLRFLLGISGWAEQEDGVWHRVGGWAPDAATQLVLRLNGLQRDILDTDARPWWWEYIRDGARRQEPAWRLEEDLRDEG
jgi:hypothetical protein